jgi:hypothetical protein
MGPQTHSSIDALKESLPDSMMVFPSRFADRVKYIIWRIYTPFHPFVRDTALKLHIVSAKAKAERWGSRQEFLLGTIAPGESIESLVQYLVGKGYGNHFVAWEDAGEMVSLRLAESFSHQYHVRIFNDGEVRGHFEYTPECYPIKHYYAEGFEDRRDYFLDLLGTKIVPPVS